jgi:quinol monooxygenase YgiN
MAELPVIVTAVFSVRPEERMRFLHAAEAVISATVAEDGCDTYVLQEGADGLPGFLFYERWRSEDDLAQHLASPHVQAFVRAVEPLLTEPIALRRWEPAG